MAHLRIRAGLGFVGRLSLLMGWGLLPLPAQSPVRPGLEVAVTDSLHLLRPFRIGYLSNHAGVDRAGRSGVDVLREAGVRLVALFSPEHGFRGTGRPGEFVPSTVDSATGLPIYSLYAGRHAPDDSMLAGLDLVLVDLPDVGARFYTYSYTTIEMMRAAARHGIPVIVLDRPNPLGGAVQGNVLDPAWRSAVGSLAVPLRHGMTLGELARLAARELDIPVALRVIPASGWRRDLVFHQTGLPFVWPSPNLRDVEALFHYPGLGLFEGTNASVGRGTAWPFHVVGAPWLDTARVLAALRAEELPGVRFEAAQFTPQDPGDGKYPSVPLRGIRLVTTDRQAYDPTVTAVAMLAALHRIHPDSFRFSEQSFDRHAGGPALRAAILAGRSAREIAAGWRPEREAWIRKREWALLYP